MVINCRKETIELGMQSLSFCSSLFPATHLQFILSFTHCVSDSSSADSWAPASNGPTDEREDNEGLGLMSVLLFSSSWHAFHSFLPSLLQVMSESAGNASPIIFTRDMRESGKSIEWR